MMQCQCPIMWQMDMPFHGNNREMKQLALLRIMYCAPWCPKFESNLFIASIWHLICLVVPIVMMCYTTKLAIKITCTSSCVQQRKPHRHHPWFCMGLKWPAIVVARWGCSVGHHLLTRRGNSKVLGRMRQTILLQTHASTRSSSNEWCSTFSN